MTKEKTYNDSRGPCIRSTISALPSSFRKTPINKMSTGKLAAMLMVEDIAMVSIADIKNEK